MKYLQQGTSFKESEILDNSIELIKTNRGGKITCHAPGSINLLFCFRFKKKKRY
jgi:lipoyl(octanoyl) transferase